MGGTHTARCLQFLHMKLPQQTALNPVAQPTRHLSQRKQLAIGPLTRLCSRVRLPIKHRREEELALLASRLRQHQLPHTPLRHHPHRAGLVSVELLPHCRDNVAVQGFAFFYVEDGVQVLHTGEGEAGQATEWRRDGFGEVGCE